MNVGFDQASHHTGEVTGLKVIERGFRGRGGDRGDRIIINSSLVFAVSRLALRRDSGWAGLSGSLSLASTGGDWRGGRGTSIVVGNLVIGSLVVCSLVVCSLVVCNLVIGSPVVGSRGSELRNSRTRELVGAAIEDVDVDAGVGVLVGTREPNEFIGAGSSGLGTANVDLDAAGVELGTSGLVSQMKGDDLVTEEVSTAGEVGRKFERMGLSVDCISSISIVNQK